jgi:glutaredoxin
MTKDFLQKNKIDYTEYNVAENESALQEMIKKSNQMGVPVIDIDGEIFVGFDRKGLMRALNIQ